MWTDNIPRNNAPNRYLNLPYLGDVQISRRNLSANEFLGMYAAPVQIVPNPSPSKKLFVLGAFVELLYGSVMSANGGNVVLQWGNTIHGGGVSAAVGISAATINGLSADTLMGLVAAQFVAPVPTTGIAGKGLFISNDTSAFTASDSTLHVTVIYCSV